MLKSYFAQGFRAILPITTGVIPFGAVMGTVAADAGLSFAQTVIMNVIVYAGAAQLAATDLMTKNAASVVVVTTGLIINLRFLLYSAAMSPLLQRSGFWTKAIAAHSLTDQGYAVMSAHEHRLPNTPAKIEFYLGTALCMMLTWESSVIAGYVFGNFAPESLALEYAVPLSFAALVIPALKNRIYISIALFSAACSVLLNFLPYRLGLIVTALLSIALGAYLTRKSESAI